MSIPLVFNYYDNPDNTHVARPSISAITATEFLLQSSLKKTLQKKGIKQSMQKYDQQ